MSYEVLCYNRGCGRTFNPRDNPADSQDCKHHPGAPFFHETYKGWTCCNKKSSDFTEFLNTPGCALGRHSREKPIEPENITGKVDDRSLEEQLEELKKSSSGKKYIGDFLILALYLNTSIDKICLIHNRAIPFRPNETPLSSTDYQRRTT